jgi:hypothetical protein
MVSCPAVAQVLRRSARSARCAGGAERAALARWLGPTQRHLPRWWSGPLRPRREPQTASRCSRPSRPFCGGANNDPRIVLPEDSLDKGNHPPAKPGDGYLSAAPRLPRTRSALEIGVKGTARESSIGLAARQRMDAAPGPAWAATWWDLEAHDIPMQVGYGKSRLGVRCHSDHCARSCPRACRPAWSEARPQRIGSLKSAACSA